MPHNGNGQEQPAKEHAPETPCAPKLDPVTRVVEADGLFVGLISLTDNAEILISKRLFGTISPMITAS